MKRNYLYLFQPTPTELFKDFIRKDFSNNMINSYLADIFNPNPKRSKYNLDYLSNCLQMELYFVQEYTFSLTKKQDRKRFDRYANLIPLYINGLLDIWFQSYYYNVPHYLKKDELITGWIQSLNDPTYSNKEVDEFVQRVLEWNNFLGLKEFKKKYERNKMAAYKKKQDTLSEKEEEEIINLVSKIEKMVKKESSKLNEEKIKFSDQNIVLYLERCKKNYLLVEQYLINEHKWSNKGFLKTINVLRVSQHLELFFSDFFTYFEGSTCSVDKANFTIQKMYEMFQTGKIVPLYEDYSKVPHMTKEYPNQKAFWSPSKLKNSMEAFEMLVMYVPHLEEHAYFLERLSRDF